LQDFGTQHAETLQSLHTKINKNRQKKRGFIQFLTGDLVAIKLINDFKVEYKNKRRIK